MHILFAGNYIIPALKYGGVERILWWLGKDFVSRGHKVTYLVKQGSYCPFAEIIIYDEKRTINEQIPDSVDVVQFNGLFSDDISKPFIINFQENINDTNIKFHRNTVFISKNQANRYNSDVYIHNCIDFNDYGTPNFNIKRNYVHFLADAAWKVKNVKGAIKIAQKAHEKLAVLGGVRFNFNMGIRITLDTHVKFYGKVGGTQKNNLINASKALLFPVLWHEPFGIAIIESLYFGCPVLATPYGSLPELVNSEVGFLSNSYTELSDALKNIQQFNNMHCHDYVVANFSAKKMADEYLAMYEKVLNGEQLNNKTPQLIEAVPKYLAMVD